jgi:hypothetical protein
MLKTLREALAIGLWLASAVQTAKYTWQSASAAGGWGSFPGLPQGSGGTGGNGPLSTPGVPTGNAKTTSVAAKAAGKEANNSLVSGLGSPKIAKAVASAGNWVMNNTFGQLPIVGGFFKSTDVNPGLLSSAQIAKLNKLPNPPQTMGVTALQSLAKNGSKNQKRNTISQLQKWAATNGWSQQDVRWYLEYVGLS